MLDAAHSAPSSALVIEGPTGWGKTWLAMRIAGPEARAVEAGEAAKALADLTTPLLIDDAHLLQPSDVVAIVVGVVRWARARQRLVIVGRIVDDAILDAVRLVDGLIVGVDELSLTADELSAALPGLADQSAADLVNATAGCVRVLARVAEAGERAMSTVAGTVTTGAVATFARLCADDSTVVRLLARIGAADPALLGEAAGDGFAVRAASAGVPLRRDADGSWSIAGAAAFRNGEIDPVVADRLADALIRRQRTLEAIGVLLDSGQYNSAAEAFESLPASMIETSDPRSIIALVNRFGSHANERAELLLTRAGGYVRLGRLDLAGTDLERASDLSGSVDAPTRRRIGVEVAEWRLIQGHRDEAIDVIEGVLAELPPGEDRTRARACTVIAEATSTFGDRQHLQASADWFATAASVWTVIGENARARGCRSEMASLTLVPLGRYDDALAEFDRLLSSVELSDNERSWILAVEGCTHYEAGRLERGRESLQRAADLGHALDNPRIVAVAAWGRALIAARCYELDETLQWIAAAENTGLGPDDDLLGVAYMCEIATALGALGQLDTAADYLARASERPPLYPDRLQQALFLLACRGGRVGDVDEQLQRTPPGERWRVLLLAAYAQALTGDGDAAARRFAEAQREVSVLGLVDFDAAGERYAADEVSRLLRTSSSAAVLGVPALQPERPTLVGRRLLVLGDTIRVLDRDGSHELPPGNAQRLVGVVAARGGTATIDSLTEAIWPGDVAGGRNRLRNVLMRLRKGCGELLTRTGNGVRLASDVSCDLHDFLRIAQDAQMTARNDPDLAGQLATAAMEMLTGEPFAELQFEEWAHRARQRVDQAAIALLDLLSIQAEDGGDLSTAQYLAERALRLDRYTDSRYVRLAELMALQGRTAAAKGILQEAALITREDHPPLIPP